MGTESEGCQAGLVASAHLGHRLHDRVHRVPKHVRGVAVLWERRLQHIACKVHVAGAQLGEHGHQHRARVVPGEADGQTDKSVSQSVILSVSERLSECQSALSVCQSAGEAD
jgi:hypothetical protein